MKKLHKIFGLAVIAVVLAVVFYACDTGNFLDVSPQGSLNSQTLANKTGVEGNLISAYAMLDGWSTSTQGLWGVAASNWIWGDVASDNAYKGSQSGDQPNITSIELYHWTTSLTDQYLNDRWRALYEGISRSNATLKLLHSVSGMSQDESDNVEGQARFLRAHYYFEAWKMWKNIPVFTEKDEGDLKATTSNEGTDPIKQIEADLNAAIKLLPTTQSEAGRVTQWTAKAYLGRVQAYSGDYSGARTTLKDVMDNGPYALADNFRDVFSVAGNNGSETILSYQASVNDGEPNGWNGDYPDRLEFPHSGSPFGCCGFYQPSQNEVNAFKVDPNNGLPLMVTQPNSWNNDDANFDSSRTAPVDPRLDWTVGRDGVPFLDWGKHEPGWIRSRSYSGPYSFKKRLYSKASGAASSVGWSSFQLNSNNLHLYRYADALLLLAEADVETGHLDEARQIVNKIRTRAGQAAQGPGTGADNIEVPINDPSITWANYQVGTYPPGSPYFADKASARLAVRAERRLELAQEGHRLFDLRRYGATYAEQVLNNFTQVEQNRRPYYQDASQFDDIDAKYYPIPSQQIDLSHGNLVQNDGFK
ncbi:MAG TPA: RagB/SusD family nutrient uptake outer membrane protein [Balneolaceae bacterium]|nr:RagB/SusD family nutrient uptake outer membrane protein [Balneolaceae bacterium]